MDYVIDADVEYTAQNELDRNFVGRCVLNNIDATGVGMKIKHIYCGYYWTEVAKQPLRELMEALYALRQTHPKIKRVMNSMYGKMIEHPPNVVTRNTTFVDEIRSNPLIRSYVERDGLTTYEYFNDCDFMYNFTIVASLLLAYQRQALKSVFIMARDNSIPVYYSAADSIAIPTEHLHKFESIMGSGLGQFKIEASGPTAVFVKMGLYYCGDKIVTSLPHKTAEDIRKYAADLGLTVEQLFKNIVGGQIYTIKANCVHK